MGLYSVIEFIFMLTRRDETIEDCLEAVAEIEPLGIRHIGFKDLGAEHATLAELHRRIKGIGAVSYLEVVSTTGVACRASARFAREIGVDCLLGGTEAGEMLEILSGSGIAYYPFPGRPDGHPTVLHGGAAEIAADCRRYAELGCAGVDLLAYRAVEAEPLELVRAARSAIPGRLIVAGGIGSPARIRDLAAAGADAFTIGSAVFDGSFSGRKGTTAAQLWDVLAAAGAVKRPAP